MSTMLEGQPALRRSLAVAFCGASLTMVACSPALNWREVKLDETGVVAQLPCRPSRHARQVTLAEQPRTLNLLSCNTDQATWGLAWIEGVQPAELGETLGALRRGALSNVGAKDREPTEFRVPGSQSHAQAGRLRTVGQRPDGSPVTQELVLFAKGLTVFQATMLAAPFSASASDEFVGALRFKP